MAVVGTLRQIDGLSIHTADAWELAHRQVMVYVCLNSPAKMKAKRDDRLMNIACSRANRLFVVIGNSHGIVNAQPNSIYSKVYYKATSLNSLILYKCANDTMPETFVNEYASNAAVRACEYKKDIKLVSTSKIMSKHANNGQAELNNDNRVYALMRTICRFIEKKIANNAYADFRNVKTHTVKREMRSDRSEDDYESSGSLVDWSSIEEFEDGEISRAMAQMNESEDDASKDKSEDGDKSIEDEMESMKSGEDKEAFSADISEIGDDVDKVKTKVDKSDQKNDASNTVKKDYSNTMNKSDSKKKSNPLA